MKKSEAAKILQILQTAYPHIYKMSNTQQAQQTIDLYFSMFGEYPIELVLTALKNYIRTNKDFPSIAGIQEQIDHLIGKQTPAELWTLVEKAIKNGTYHAVREFEKLPDAAKAWLGNADKLSEYAKQDIDTLQTVTKGQFLKTIGGIQAKQQAQESLPDNLKNQIKQLTDKMSM